ncbi:hypothetical protein GX586_02850 [bacterium]|nr:hypothetical protein [bacterium]
MLSGKTDNLKKGTLPRLDPAAYIGYKHVSFTAVTLDRRHVFVRRAVVDPCIAMLSEDCARHNCECLVYVFMPDHVHLILHGCDASSDVLQSHNTWKGRTGNELCGQFMCHTIWQPRSRDHVLRSHEYERGALRNMLQYALQNPARAGLVSTWQDYPFVGSLIGPYDIRHPYWWDWFYNGRE